MESQQCSACIKVSQVGSSTNIKLIQSPKIWIHAGGWIHDSDVVALEAVDEVCSGVYNGNTGLVIDALRMHMRNENPVLAAILACPIHGRWSLASPPGLDVMVDARECVW